MKKVAYFVPLVAILLNFSSEAQLSGSDYYNIGECFEEIEQHLNPIYGLTLSDIISNTRILDSTYALDCSARNDNKGGLLYTNKGLTPCGQLCIYLFPSSGLQFCIDNNSEKVLARVIAMNNIAAYKIIALFLKIAALTRASTSAGPKHPNLILYNIITNAEINPTAAPDKEATDYLVAAKIYNQRTVPRTYGKIIATASIKFKEQLAALGILDTATLNNEATWKVLSPIVKTVIESVRAEEQFYAKYWTEFLIHNFARFLLSSAADLKNLVREMKRLELITCTDEKIALIGQKPPESYFENLKKFSTSQAVDYVTSHAILTTPYDDGVSPQSSQARDTRRPEGFADCVETAIRVLSCILLYNSETGKFYKLPTSVPPATRELFEGKKDSEIANDSDAAKKRVIYVTDDRNAVIKNDFADALGMLPVIFRDKDSHLGACSIKSGCRNIINALGSAFNLPIGEVEGSSSSSSATSVGSAAKSLEVCLNKLVRLTREDVTIFVTNAQETLRDDGDCTLKATVTAKKTATGEQLYSFTFITEEGHTQIANIINVDGKNAQLLKVVQTKHTPRTIFDCMPMYDRFYEDKIIANRRRPAEDTGTPGGGRITFYKDKYIDFMKKATYRISPLVRLMFFANLNGNDLSPLESFFRDMGGEQPSMGIWRNYMYAVAKRAGHDAAELKHLPAALPTSYVGQKEPKSLINFYQIALLYSGMNEEIHREYWNAMTDLYKSHAGTSLKQEIQNDPNLVENYISSQEKTFSEKRTLLNMINGGDSNSPSGSGSVAASSSSSSSSSDGASRSPGSSISDAASSSSSIPTSHEASSSSSVQSIEAASSSSSSDDGEYDETV